MTFNEAFEKTKNFMKEFLVKRRFFFVNDKSIETVTPEFLYTVNINYYPSEEKGDDFGVVIETPLGKLTIDDAHFCAKDAVEELLQKLEEEEL